MECSSLSCHSWIQSARRTKGKAISQKVHTALLFICNNFVIWPHLASGVAEKCFFLIYADICLAKNRRLCSSRRGSGYLGITAFPGPVCPPYCLRQLNLDFLLQPNRNTSYLTQPHKAHIYLPSPITCWWIKIRSPSLGASQGPSLFFSSGLGQHLAHRSIW